MVDIESVNDEVKMTVEKISQLRATIEAITERFDGMGADGFVETILQGLKVNWITLGSDEFVDIANSARRPVKASLREPGKTPYYGANNVQDYVEGYTHDGEYILIAEDGSASLEKYSIQYATGKFWANNHVHVIRGKACLSTKFLYHYLRTVDFVPYLPNKDRSKLTKGDMVKIPIPLPCPNEPEKSLQIQSEIVSVLDAFAELNVELNAEVNARDKQHNFYRRALLRFPTPEVAA